jgi:hypothetical protein
MLVGLVIKTLNKDVGFVKPSVPEVLPLNKAPLRGAAMLLGGKNSKGLHDANAVFLFFLNDTHVFAH